MEFESENESTLTLTFRDHAGVYKTIGCIEIEVLKFRNDGEVCFPESVKVQDDDEN